MIVAVRQDKGEAPERELQNAARGRKGRAADPTLTRTTFRTSREAEFLSEKELTAQIGHDVGDWPLVVVKELIDNAADACEDAGVSPVVEVVADAGGISVRDNGPGLPDATLDGAMDFTVRASSREAYVAPDRGAQGNALKTLIAMPRVIDPKHGRLIVTARGRRHVITCVADPISQRAVVRDDVEVHGRDENVKTGGPTRADKPCFLGGGTEVRIQWEARTDGWDRVVWPFGELAPLREDDDAEETFADRFRAVVEGFAVFNPHATVRLNWFGDETVFEATDPAWPKWRPSRPTSPHWYEPKHLERLVGAYVTHDRDAGGDRLVSEFLAEFDGLSGSAKRTKVLTQTGLKRAKLSAFVSGDRLDSAGVAALLAAMREHTRPVKPKALGVLGEEHLRRRLLGFGVRPESFRYAARLSKDGLPWVLESAFGYLGPRYDGARRIYAGVNWSAAIGNPFRSFGSTRQGLEAALTEMRAGADEPIVLVLHLAHPRPEYCDRGKTSLIVAGGRRAEP